MRRGVGAQPYSGRDERSEETYLGSTTAWPVSILIGGHQQQGMHLPASEHEAGYVVLLPACVPIFIQPGDALTDDLERRYRVQTAEATDMGWRLHVYEVHP